MKKLLLIILMCASTLNTTRPMEQPADMEHPLDLTYIVRTCPNQIVSQLDGKTLSSLVSTSHLLRETCDAVPTKYLTILFSDVADHGNTKLIDRFITQPDSWILIKETNEISSCNLQENNKSNNIEVFECHFSKSLQQFLGDYRTLMVTQNKKTIRYISQLKNDDSPWIMYLNTNESNDAVNKSLIHHLSSAEQHMLNTALILNFINKKAHGCIIYIKHNSLQRKSFFLTDSSHSPQGFLKQLGLINTFFIAAQKNHTALAYAILNNSKIVDSWSSDILEIALYAFNNGNEIKDVVAAILFERPKNTLKNTK